MSAPFSGLSFYVDSGDDDTDVEAELEVDQLDSDTDPEEPVDSVKARKVKNGTHRPGERIPGHTLLPAVKLENMIQADGVTGNLALSKEGLFVLSIATEEFIKRLIQAGHREASAHCRNQINYTDMAATTQQYQEFMCLADTIPPPVSLADALAMREEKERELLEDNPALAVPFVPSAIPSPEPELTNGNEMISGSVSHHPGETAKISTTSRSRSSKKPPLQTEPEPLPQKETVTMPVSTSRVKSRKLPLTNEKIMLPPKETVNLSANTSRVKNRKPPPNADTIPVTERDTANISVSTSRVKNRKPPPINNHRPESPVNVDSEDVDGVASSYRKSPRNGSYVASTLPLPSDLPAGLSPSHSPPYYSPTHSREESSEPGFVPSRDPESQSFPNSFPPWAGQFTGPASGFIRGPPPFSRATQNPGRTIYSQDHPSD